MNEDEGTITMETPEGSFTQTSKEDGAKDVTVPKDFPTDIPTPEGMELTNSSTFRTDEEGTVFILQWTTTTLPENLLQNYESVLKQKGWVTSLMDQGNQGGTLTFLEDQEKPDNEQRGGAFTVTPVEGQTQVQLIIKEPTVQK